MRRFEFVQGTSAKFWMTDVQGSTFIVVYGRLGTAGQRKEKDFASPDAARREIEKKVAEKLREGYHEVSSGAGAPAGAKGAAAAAAPLALPPRVERREPTPERVQAAVEALTKLAAARGVRSWALRFRSHLARKALERIAGVDPAAHADLGRALDAALARVVAASSADRLPLTQAMELLLEVDASAFARAVNELWQAVPAGHPAGPAIAVLQKQLTELSDPELAVRVGALLTARPAGDAPGWDRRWKALSPHLEAYLARSGSSLKKYLQGLDAGSDPHVERRIEEMRAA